MFYVVITSASRPELIPMLVKSFKKYVTLPQHSHIIFHEDVISTEQSEQTLDYIRQNDFTDTLLVTDPAQGWAAALSRCFEIVKSNFVFFTSEDYEFERKVNVQDIISVMKSDEYVNQILLRQTPIRKSETNLTDFGRFSAYQAPKFNFHPGVWRTNYFLKYWNDTDYHYHPENTFNQNNDLSGSYRIDGYNHMRHTGYHHRVQEWHRGMAPQLEKEKRDLKNRDPNGIS